MTRPNVLPADILICGGSFGAPAAALAAARTWPEARIVLTEPTDWLGGQATSQGVSAIDNAWHEPAKSLMRDRPAAHYPADYLDWLDRMRHRAADAPGEGLSADGTCWVSRESYDPRTAAWALDQMLAEAPNVTVLKMTTVRALATRPAAAGSTEITSATLITRDAKPGYTPFSRLLSQELPDWYSPEASDSFSKHITEIVPAQDHLVVIDASETGDAIVLSGAHYTIGRERTTEQPAADGTPAEHDELAPQATVFCFCETGSAQPDAEQDLAGLWPDFEAYYEEQEARFFSFLTHGFHRVWTYRRLKTNATLGDWDTIAPDDVTMQNWNPGNDYPYGSIYLNRAETAAESAHGWRGGLNLHHLAMAEKHAVAYHFFVKRTRPTAYDVIMTRGNHPMNMMGTPHGLAKFPYIRCGRRIVGIEGSRLLQESFADSQAPGATVSLPFVDSVGIGCYASDVHALNGSTGIGARIHLPAPFHIPLRTLLSQNVVNLVAGAKSFSQSFWVNSAYRLHPIEWSVGSAAGAAAAIMGRQKLSGRELWRQHFREVQAAVAVQSPIYWPTWNGGILDAVQADVLINGGRAVIAGRPFKVAAVHPAATKATVQVGGAPAVATARLAEQFVASDLVVAEPGSHDLLVTFVLAGNTIAAKRTVTVQPPPPPTDELIVDDASPMFSVTGIWKRGASMEKAHDATCAHTTGAMPGCVATWNIDVPDSGPWRLELWSPSHASAAKDVPVVVLHAHGEKWLRVDQRAQAGTWVDLGVYSLGDEAKVMLNNDVSDPDSTVLADAVRARRVKR